MSNVTLLECSSETLYLTWHSYTPCWSRVALSTVREKVPLTNKLVSQLKPLSTWLSSVVPKEAIWDPLKVQLIPRRESPTGGTEIEQGRRADVCGRTQTSVGETERKSERNWKYQWSIHMFIKVLSLLTNKSIIRDGWSYIKMYLVTKHA